MYIHTQIHPHPPSQSRDPAQAGSRQLQGSFCAARHTEPDGKNLMMQSFPAAVGKAFEDEWPVPQKRQAPILASGAPWPTLSLRVSRPTRQ